MTNSVLSEYEFNYISSDLKRKSGIYKIIINNNYYIGSACNLYQRLHHHKTELLLNRHANGRLQNCFNKYKKVEFELLEFCQKEYLVKVEQDYIDSLKPKYNIRKIATSNLGLKMSDECKKNRSKTSLKWHKEVGFSAETILKLKEAGKGRVPSKACIEASIESTKNRIWSEETRKLKSDIMKKIRKESLNYNFKGEKNPQSKLKDYQVVEILTKLKDGNKQNYIANEYGVSAQCINLISRNKSYKHVERCIET